MASALTSLSKRKQADALVLPFFEGQKPAFSGKSLATLYAPPLKAKDFSGKAEQVVVHYPPKGKEKRLVLVGLGKENQLTKEIVRRSYAEAMRAIKEKAKSVTIQVPETDLEELSEAVVEGVLLANYIFDANQSKKAKALSRVNFIGVNARALKHNEIRCKGVCYTRDLSFENADTITPAYLANEAKKLSQKYSALKTTVLDRKLILKHGLGLIEAVSRGASKEPALIMMEYKGAPKSKELTALVGKGVTYDTGGLNLKPAIGMKTMRDDMAGAASILGTMQALCALKLPLNVVGVIGTTENAIGPDSYKLGDVYRSFSGVTVEINDTDAEGRLVLADAICYAEKTFKPQRIIDIATLTGGAIVALGEEASAIMSNDDVLAELLIQAGESTYERLWRLPLYEEYKELLSSKIADMKNSGARKASPIQGGIFLQRFIKNAKWAHIDIAGTSFPDSLKPYQPIQSTGVGVRLFLKFLENLC